MLLMPEPANAPSSMFVTLFSCNTPEVLPTNTEQFAKAIFPMLVMLLPKVAYFSFAHAENMLVPTSFMKPSLKVTLSRFFTVVLK